MQAVTDLKKFETPLDYKGDRERLKKFVLFYSEDGSFKYLERLRNLMDAYDVDLNDVATYDESGLATRIAANAWSYAQLLSKVLDELLYHDEAVECGTDIFYHQRIARFKERYPDRNPLEAFPAFLLRNYTINFRPLARQLARDAAPAALEVLPLRRVGSEHIGALVTVRGIVTRVSMAKPAMRVAAYICESCGSETYQQVSSDAFDMLEECASEKCKTRNIRGTLTLLTRGSRFLKHQTVIIQELTGEVPHGSIPRSMKVELNASLTGLLSPGQMTEISGIFLPRPYYGLRRLKAGLLNDTYLMGMHVAEGRAEEALCEAVDRCAIEDNPGDSPAAALLASILPDAARLTVPVMDLLIESFAPEIFGMRDVKKILLLMLAGAPTLERPDGLRIRGDINCLLLGDPGIAKSQLLKTMTKIARRGVYTTGRGSSGVGLTAAVCKDPVTGEVVLEGGALVLSDKGVCCIDELDKMTDTDRVAIHEVMEQQRVSISKAGINTTLNARCSILAAANPVSGRYNPRKSVEHNVGLPCSLLSRFDVLCILKDDPSENADLSMAYHVTGMHTTERATGSATAAGLSYAQMRAYFEAVREISPVLVDDDHNAFVASYLKARRENPSTTPRALLALIRLALAHARLHARHVVTSADVEEARLLLETMRVPVPKPAAAVSTKQAIYHFIVSLANAGIVRLSELFARCDYPREEIEYVIADFEKSGLWIRNNEEIELLN
ncbi:DNA replication licensing factor MCM7 [Pancytospora philotis]|nr:DNA replication licensing factor MCM7 [Pancytospora philotis]